jgi:hypothetical protein
MHAPQSNWQTLRQLTCQLHVHPVVCGSCSGGVGVRVGFTLHLAAQAASSTHIPLLPGSGPLKAEAASAVTKEEAIRQGVTQASTVSLNMPQACSWSAGGCVMPTQKQQHRT